MTPLGLPFKWLEMQESPKPAAEDGETGTRHWEPVGPAPTPSLEAPQGFAKECRRGELLTK